jgi:hypothetical protein
MMVDSSLERTSILLLVSDQIVRSVRRYWSTKAIRSWLPATLDRQ